MATSIYKYPLSIRGEQILSLPVGTIPLSVHVQRGVPCLWAMVDPKQPLRSDRTILMCPTGDHGTDRARTGAYIGTTLHEDGALVWHWFIRP